MNAYAYFDSNGNLLEFVSDNGLRQGNAYTNTIFLVLDGISLIGKSLRADYKNADGSGSYLTRVVSTASQRFRFPSFIGRDFRHFIQGKEYDFIPVELPSDVLESAGSKYVTVSVNQVIGEQETLVLKLHMINFYVEESVLQYNVNIDRSQFDYLVAVIGSKVNKSGDTMTGNLWITGSNKLKLGSWEIYQDEGSVPVLYFNPNEVSSIEASCDIYCYNLVPLASETYDLGGQFLKWKDLWLSGSLKDGTNSVTIANIVDKTKNNAFTYAPTYQGSPFVTQNFVENLFRNLGYLKDAEFLYSGDTVKLRKTYHTATEQERTVDEVVHLANSTTAGLMSPSTVLAIQQMRQEIDSLEQQNVRLLYTTKSNPTAQEIRTFVSSFIPDSTKWISVGVVIKDTNHIWRYFNNTQLWTDIGIDTVNQFTNLIAGIIKGSEADGKIYAEDDGTGSVNGWDALLARVLNVENNKLDKPKTAPIIIQSSDWDESGEFEYDLEDQGIEVGENDLVTVYGQDDAFYIYHLSYKKGSTNSKVLFKVLGEPDENIELLITVESLGGNENA